MSETGAKRSSTAKAPSPAPEQEAAATQACIRDLDARPGFLIRRLHQIHIALFAEECGAEGITPVQYSVLTALKQMGPAEQIALSRAVGLDRTNIADVIVRLEQRALVTRSVSPTDKRMRLAGLTEAGLALLKRVEQGAARAHERTIEALPPQARARFLKDLRALVAAKNEVSRSPVGTI
ncbi:MarR family winged helix-turn-helix transcriptional regulator [Roseixanthobacter liquoris]|uniref:MarR family winged helix-turn-helix transcriptional regulator n=1 Tax=Roseixanthobacter liquoris TaxID=3119921 RepID=UPI00372A3B39